MFIQRFFLTVLLAVSTLAMVESQAAPFDRYIGVLKHDRLQQDQLAKLDFVISRSDANQINLRAILTLHFGGFDSGEYSSYHFDDVIFNLVTGQLTFDQSDQDITLTTTSFGGGRLVGEIRSASIGKVGEIVLTQSAPAAPTQGLIAPLNGRYSSTCEGKTKTLQLSTFRATEDTSRIGNPFGCLDVRGHSATRSRLCSIDGEARDCVTSRFDTGSYNFFSGEVKLSGSPAPLSCKVSGSKVVCDGCEYTRVSDEMTSPALKPPQSPVAFDVHANSEGVSAGIAGEYTGFVHHEYLNRFQRASINLVTYQGTGTSGPVLKISGIGALQFGEADSGEKLSYHFEPVDFPNPLAKPNFILGRPEADTDAMIRVTYLKDGVIKGEWNSILFGRVGTFEMRKTGEVTLPADAKMVTSLAGEYRSSEWLVNLGTRLGRTPINTENPFFPLELTGYVWSTRGISTRLPILGGSYDYYTGRFGIVHAGETFDINRGSVPSEDEYLVGIRDENGKLKLRRVVGDFIDLLQAFDLKPFDRM